MLQASDFETPISKTVGQSGDEPTPADWATYNYDVTGTRYNVREKSLSPENIGQLEQKWQFPAEGDDRTVGVIHATPSVVDGYVYFGTATYPTFYSSRPDGKVRWSYPIGDRSPRLSRRPRTPWVSAPPTASIPRPS